MMPYLIPGACGFVLGMLLHWTRLDHPCGLKKAIALRRSHSTRSALYAAGCAVALTALLCYLAVIDVDTIVVYPLHLGVIAGGVLYGIAAGLCGFTPITAIAGIGSRCPVEALCTLAGAALAVMLPLPQNPLANQPPLSVSTLFQVTLDEPWLYGGGFLSLGCLGLLLMALAACIPGPKTCILTDEEVAEHAAALPMPEGILADVAVAILPESEID